MRCVNSLPDFQALFDFEASAKDTYGPANNTLGLGVTHTSGPQEDGLTGAVARVIDLMARHFPR